MIKSRFRKRGRLLFSKKRLTLTISFDNISLSDIGDGWRNQMDEALTDSTYLILLALLKPKHGYLIMKQIDDLSQGTFEIGPATMYTILKKLTKKGWIDLEESVDRKKIYQITLEGRQILEKDIQRRKLFYQIGEQVFEALGGDQDGHQ
jgi:DNA-binding PadR family transcriptional regulator